MTSASRNRVEIAISERKRSLEAGSKKSILLWSSVAAATAGIVAVAAIFAWKARTVSSEKARHAYPGRSGRVIGL